MVKIYLIRHGQTYLNKLNRMQGWVDSDLTELGIQQAANAGKSLSHMKFAAIISSDLSRAAKTKNIILKQLVTKPLITFESCLFREVRFGSFDALPIAEAWNKALIDTKFNNQEDVIYSYNLSKARTIMANKDPYHLAEFPEEVHSRWIKGLNTIFKASYKFDKNDNILIVTHGTFIRSIIELYGVNTYNNPPKNASISILEYNSQTKQINLLTYNSSMSSIDEW